MFISYYLSSRFIESDRGRKVSGCLLFLFLLVLQSEISLAPQAIPWVIPQIIPQATTISELHILHYNSFDVLHVFPSLLPNLIEIRLGGSGFWYIFIIGYFGLVFIGILIILYCLFLQWPSLPCVQYCNC